LKQLLVRLLRLSPAMVVAMIALFVALTGTAVATTSALITGSQIRNNSITGADIKNKSLRPIDFRGSVRGPRGLRGLAGPAGQPGAQGIQGPPGAPNPNAVDSDKVDGLHANEVTRVGGDFDGVNLTINPTIIGSVVIDAPRSGYVLVTASGQPQASAGCPCRAVMQLVHQQTAEVSHFAVDDVRFDIFDGYDGNLAVTALFPVVAGTNTFNLRAYHYGGPGGSAIFFNHEITALYSPFGATGAPLSVSSIGGKASRWHAAQPGPGS
jgi:hypothetical protein